LWDIDLAVLEPLDQILRRDVDELDRIGAIEDRIGHRLAYADMSDLSDDVVKTLNVLNVECGVDIDAVVEQLLDIKIALGVPAAGGVGVRKLICHDKRGTPRQNRVEVHFVERTILIIDTPARNGIEPFRQRLGLFATVSLDDTDDDVPALFKPGARLEQHLI